MPHYFRGTPLHPLGEVGLADDGRLWVAPGGEHESLDLTGIGSQFGGIVEACAMPHANLPVPGAGRDASLAIP